MYVSSAIFAGPRISGSIAARQGRQQQQRPTDERRQRQTVSEHSGAHQRARPGAAGHAAPGHRPLLGRDGRHHRELPRRPAHHLRHQGPNLHLRRQRPWRLGGRGEQRALARRHHPRAGERALRRRLGRDGPDDGRRDRDAERRLAPRGRPGRAGGAPEARQGRRHQGHPGRADRYGLRRRQRHPGHPQGDRRGQASRPADGRLRRLARLHAVRHGRLGRRRRHVRARRRAS